MREGHVAVSCGDGQCKRCGTKHNSLLCSHNWTKTTAPIHRAQNEEHGGPTAGDSTAAGGAAPSAGPEESEWGDAEPLRPANMPVRPVASGTPTLMPPPASLASWDAQVRAEASVQPYLAPQSAEVAMGEPSGSMAARVAGEWRTDSESSGSSSDSSTTDSDGPEQTGPVVQTKAERKAFKREQDMRARKKDVTLSFPRSNAASAARAKKKAQAEEPVASAQTVKESPKKSNSPTEVTGATVHTVASPSYADMAARPAAGSSLEVPDQPPAQLLQDADAEAELVHASLEDLSLREEPQHVSPAAAVQETPRNRQKQEKKKTPKKK